MEDFKTLLNEFDLSIYIIYNKNNLKLSLTCNTSL